MIAYIEGRLLAADDDGCIVLTPGGVGYRVFLTAPGRAGLPAKGEELCLHCLTVVREDSLELFGFSNQDERETFEVLLAISKVGPRIGLAILSVFTPGDLRRVVAEDDPQALTIVPGVGKKSAQHIFLELKYKLKTADDGLAGAQTGAGSVQRDAVAGLTGLGYTEDEARPAVTAALDNEPELDVAEAIRAALKHLARSR